MATEKIRILDFFFSQNEFWYTSVRNRRFCKWPWILNLSKYYISRYNNSILLTIMGCTDHSSRGKLDVYVTRANSKEKPCTTNWYLCKICKAMKVTSVSKIWVKMCNTINIHLHNSKFKVTCKNTDFECWYIGTHIKEKPFKISDIEVAILLSSHQNTLI